MAIRAIYATYSGWDGAIYFSEEVERPDRNVARATFTGVALVTGLYVLVNAAVLHVLSPAAIAGSKLAVGDAAKVTLGAVGDTVITTIGRPGTVPRFPNDSMSVSRPWVVGPPTTVGTAARFGTTPVPNAARPLRSRARL